MINKLKLNLNKKIMSNDYIILEYITYYNKERF